MPRLKATETRIFFWRLGIQVRVCSSKSYYMFYLHHERFDIISSSSMMHIYVYKKDRLYPTKQHWRCTVSGCPRRLHTDLADPPVVVKNVKHLTISRMRSWRGREELRRTCALRRNSVRYFRCLR